jgi:hypothetical protein
MVIEVASILQAISVILACWAVIQGIDAWKREFIGKRKIEVAEQTLAKFFEVKDAIRFIRNPFAHIEEGKSRKRSPNETESESDALDRGYVAIERYQKKESALADFSALKYKFMASFGPQTEEIFSETFKIANSIVTASQTLAHHYWGRSRFGSQPDAYERGMKEMQAFESIIWDHGEGDDKIMLKLAELQKELDDVTKPCFEEQMAGYTALTRKRSIFKKDGKRSPAVTPNQT